MPTIRPSSMCMMRLANGISRIMRHHQHAAARILGDLRQHLHDDLSVGAVQRRGRLVARTDDGFATMARAIATRLLLAAAELAGVGFDLVGEADRRHRFLCLGSRRPGALAAHVQGEADIVQGRQVGNR